MKGSNLTEWKAQSGQVSTERYRPCGEGQQKHERLA